MPVAFSFALANAGKSNPARIAIMAMTTNNSIRVKPNCRSREYDPRLRDFIWETDRDGMSWKQVKSRLKVVVV